MKKLNSKQVKGILALMLVYLFVCISINLLGFNIFKITETNFLLDSIKNNYLIYIPLMSLMFTVSNIFLIAIVCDIYSSKKLTKIFFKVFLLSNLINLYIMAYDVPEIIFSCSIPFLLCLIYSKEHINFSILKTIFYMLIVAVLQLIMLYLKIDILNLQYYNESLFNVILLNFDTFLFLYFIFIYKKLNHKED